MAVFAVLLAVWMLLLFGVGVVIGRATHPEGPPPPVPTPKPMPGVVRSALQ